ncbi:MAG TPA: DHHA1 domain-containing protein [Vicinamibacterales bacterium]|nr:DHHA1 domain-containing protein [Vicinamibacterales bacterium]
MTERLYYADCYLTEFDAAVTRVLKHEGRPAVVLDRTAFYPTSGGQPFDIGRLGNARVVDVVESDDGDILHVIEGELAPGDVKGTIDWARRFEHMQQHTGQHVLSAAFERVAGARTESFHLGSSSSTIDLNRALTPADIERAEDEANRIIWENLPVAVRFASAEEAAALPLRKESMRTGTLRLIEVPGFDLSACGGTHVARTGAIGMAVVASSERFRGGTRVEFLCGVRAARGYRLLRDAVAASVRLVSVLPGELPAGIERLHAEMKETRRTVKNLQTRLATFEGLALADRAETVGPVRAVITAVEGWDQNGLKSLTTAITARPGHVAALVSAASPFAAVIARAPDVTIDCALILKKLIERFGGKGGGRPDLAQGGGLQGDPDEILRLTREIISTAV